MLLRILGSVWALSMTACAVAPQHAALSGEVVIARYAFDVDGMESEFPQPAGGLIPDVIEGVRTGREIGEALATLKNPEGSVYKQTADAALREIQQTLEQRTPLRLAPTDRLRGRVPYLLGYPLGSAKGLAREGVAPLLAEIDVSVTVPDQATGYFAWLGTGTAHSVGRPEMILQLSVLDQSGRVVWRDQVIVRSEQKVTLDERWLLGVNSERQVSDAQSLPLLTRRAIEALVSQSQARRG